LKTSNRQKGVTLIELVIAMALISVITILAFSALLFGSRNFSFQSSDISNRTQVNNVVRDITNEIRKGVDLDEIEIFGNKLVVGSVEYLLVGNEIQKNGEFLAGNIEMFEAQKESGALKLTVKAVDTGSKVYMVSTKIFIRE